MGEGVKWNGGVWRAMRQVRYTHAGGTVIGEKWFGRGERGEGGTATGGSE